MTGTKPIPSVNSFIPKVNRSTVVSRSIPTVANRTPNAPDMMLLIDDSSPIEANIDSPKTVRAKYSGGANL